MVSGDNDNDTTLKRGPFRPQPAQGAQHRSKEYNAQRKRPRLDKIRRTIRSATKDCLVVQIVYQQ